MADAAQHLGRSDHLRDCLGRHEGADLYGAEARSDQRLDEGDPVRDADRRLLVLQPVARADFDDMDAIAHDAAGSSSASSTPSPTISPTLHLIFFNTPANGARRVCSIFMTSRVRIAAPFSSVAPSSASSATTVPGKGATILSSPTCSSVSPPNGSTQCRSKRPLRVRRYSSCPSITARMWDFMPSSVRSRPPSTAGEQVKANSSASIDSIAKPLPYFRVTFCSAPCLS